MPKDTTSASLNRSLMLSVKWLASLSLRHRREWIRGNALALGATLVSVPIPLLIPLLVDEVVLHRGGHWVDTLRLIGVTEGLHLIGVTLIVTVGLRIVFWLLSVWAQRYFSVMAQSLSLSLRTHALEHLRSVAMSAYERLGSGRVITHLISDIETIEQFMSNALSKLVISIAPLLGVGIVLMWIHPLFGIVILIFQPLIMIFTRRISARVGHLKKEHNESIGTFSQTITQVCDLFGQIRASNQEERFIAHAITEAQALKERSIAYTLAAFRGERASYTLFLSGFEVFRALGLVLVLYSDLSLGLMFAIFGYLWFMMTPVQELLSLQYSYAGARNALDRLNTLLALENEPRPLSPHPWPQRALAVTAEHIHFGYDPNVTVLHDISLHIDAGSKVAIIGASGSGKSTLAQILVGFYPPNGGTLRYNGIDVEHLGCAQVRAHVFLVLQQPLLFNDTLRFNLTMGDIMEDAIILEALEMAQLGAFVRGLRDGLDTHVGKMGIRLSGGERQRLSIARMILANPDMVIFDESTSALDVHTEGAIFETLEPFLASKTVITIAHRLSTLRRAEYIYVLEKGRILEEGDYETLHAQEGRFTHFVHVQANAQTTPSVAETPL